MMQSKRTGLAKGIDYLAICGLSYFLSLFLFARMGVESAFLPWVSLILAMLLIAMLALIKRKLSSGKNKDKNQLRTQWLTYLTLKNPGECLAILKPLLTRKYSLTDVELDRDKSNAPYISCRHGANRLIITCSRTPSVDSIINLASLAIENSAQNAVFICLSAIPEVLPIPALPIAITKFGSERVKQLMPPEYEGLEKYAPIQKSSFLSRLVNEAIARDKAMRYTFYGFGLVMLYFVMRFTYALVPGIICFALGILSHLRPKPKDSLISHNR